MTRLLISIAFLFSLSLSGQENRTITGHGNNLENQDWGSVHGPVLRVSTPNYLDGVEALDTIGRPSERQVSNMLFSQEEPIPNKNSLSDFVWLFGQFIDHDLSLVNVDRSMAPHIFEIPDDDPHFGETGALTAFRNSILPNTGEQGIPREFANEVTSFLDASMIYGSTQERSDWLRTFEGGKLWTSQNGPTGSGDLLPWNTTTKEFGGGAFIDISAPEMESGGNDKYFVCGDARANENPLLLAIHTLFVREHNRICDELAASYATWTDEQLYQRARKQVGAHIQSITYEEWLPAIGVRLPDYMGYKVDLEPGIFNVFSAAAFRIGHTMIDSDIIRMDIEGNEISAGNLTLEDGFFKPLEIYNAKGIEAYLQGMGTQVMQEMDCKMVDDLRNFLFDGQTKGLDLASINIFRGRDRGLADFNTLREDFGLPPLASFDQLTDHTADREVIASLYDGDIDRIDAWVGMLSENHINDEAVFGELVVSILREQFRLLRDADRFYYENDPAFSQIQIEDIKATTLHDIIMRNTQIELMQPNVFEAMPHEEIENPIVVEGSPLATRVFPNPMVDQAEVRIYSEEDGVANYKILDSNGQRMASGQITLVQGQDNFLTIEASEFLMGIYHLLLESRTQYSVTKLVKQ